MDKEYLKIKEKCSWQHNSFAECKCFCCNKKRNESICFFYAQAKDKTFDLCSSCCAEIMENLEKAQAFDDDDAILTAIEKQKENIEKNGVPSREQTILKSNAIYLGMMPDIEDKWCHILTGYQFYHHEFMCTRCGSHYLRRSVRSDTQPYCLKCFHEIEAKKAKERLVKKDQSKINAVLDKIEAEIQDYDDTVFLPASGNKAITVDAVLEIIKKYKRI